MLLLAGVVGGIAGYLGARLALRGADRRAVDAVARQIREGGPLRTAVR